MLLTIGTGVTSTGVTVVVLSTGACLGSKTFKSIKVPTVIAYSSPRRFKTQPADTSKHPELVDLHKFKNVWSFVIFKSEASLLLKLMPVPIAIMLIIKPIAPEPMYPHV